MNLIQSEDVILSFLTLTLLEIILGIDNIIFISILADKLPKEIQKKARLIGLFLAMFFRIILLFGISIIVHMEKPLFVILNHGITGRDIILFGGGVFLIFKTIKEIIEKIKGHSDSPVEIDSKKKLNLLSAVSQIIMIDIVFSFDSILTAVGLVNDVRIMIAAVIVAVIIMMWASGPISKFVNDNPSIKMLALNFLVLIGILLILEALHIEFSKNYLYFAMFFSVANELMIMLSRKNARIVRRKHHPMHGEQK
ncbi:MAG: TerC family protein [Opitutaceae bacterium]|nr:TerC family protein [Cytophagales bacterium]